MRPTDITCRRRPAPSARPACRLRHRRGGRGREHAVRVPRQERTRGLPNLPRHHDVRRPCRRQRGGRRRRPRPRRRRQLRRHGRSLLRRPVGAGGRQGDREHAVRLDPRHQGRQPDGRGAHAARAGPPLADRGLRGQPASAADRLDRFLLHVPRGSRHAARRGARRRLGCADARNGMAAGVARDRPDGAGPRGVAAADFAPGHPNEGRVALAGATKQGSNR